MRKLLVLAIVLALVAVAPLARAADEELKIFIWSEYMDEEKMPADFTERTGIKVRIDLYENNEEMLAKLQAGGVSQYDIIVPSDYIMPVLINQKLVLPLDKSKIPNFKNLMPIFKNSPFAEYGAAWQWGTVGLMYRKDKVKNFQNTWGMLFDPKYDADIGPFWLIDSVREMMGIALLYKGFDFNSTNPEELKAAADLLVDTKKRQNCQGFKPGVGGKNDVVAGTANAAIVYNGDAIQSISEDPEHLAFAVPKEGSEVWNDYMCIPAKAPNVEAAYKWINFVLDPQIGADLSNYNQYATPNEASLPFITPEDLKNPSIYPTEEEMKRLHFTKDLGKDTRIMDEAWTRAKSH